jgi:hypothetical protein
MSGKERYEMRISNNWEWNARHSLVQTRKLGLTRMADDQLAEIGQCFVGICSERFVMTMTLFYLANQVWKIFHASNYYLLGRNCQNFSVAFVILIQIEDDGNIPQQECSIWDGFPHQFNKSGIAEIILLVTAIYFGGLMFIGGLWVCSFERPCCPSDITFRDSRTVKS